MYKLTSFFLTLFTALMLLSGCANQSGGPSKFSALPYAYGDFNQLIVIADNDIWNGAVGDSFRFYYSAAFPILPQPEPIFDLLHFTPEQLKEDPLRKELRHIMVLSNVKDENAPATKLAKSQLGSEKVNRFKGDPSANNSILKDKWAQGQIVIFQLGNGEENLIQNFKLNFPAVRKRLTKEDKSKLDATVYLDGRNPAVENEIKATMGIDIKIPGEYKMAINEDTLIWLRRETRESSSNIMLYTTPYTDPSQLTKEGIKEMRDLIGKKISSEDPGTFMRVNDKDLPFLVYAAEINGQYAVEARGIWEIVNDYMGGAFVSYAILTSDKKNIVFADGFIHAPGEQKRNFMQYMDYVLRSIQIEDVVN